jgi:predicted transcriptional regulator
MNELLETIRARSRASSQAVIAKQLGVSQATVSRLLSGKRRPGRAVLVGIVKAWPELSDEAVHWLRQM